LLPKYNNAKFLILILFKEKAQNTPTIKGTVSNGIAHSSDYQRAQVTGKRKSSERKNH